MTRRRWSVTEKLSVLVRQASCPLCGERLGLLANCDFDHETALVNGGADSVANLRAVHRDCHKVKTFGKGGSIRISNRGSDISEPRRIERMAERHKEFCRTALAPKKRKPVKAKKAGRAWPKRTLARKGPSHG